MELASFINFMMLHLKCALLTCTQKKQFMEVRGTDWMLNGGINIENKDGDEQAGNIVIFH